ncbi:Hypothetical predicted protein [Marmota monax]|uniref:Uncharacterized protein n=1 Tax=Marmota monax TaxID=9995 RepID=A0A5E4A462_MARMO|nr:hypothetical protein GHT09_008231 [Marmota monax]VTJ51819.1 Hypothetical predicted protein [Marmota monax]
MISGSSALQDAQGSELLQGLGRCISKLLVAHLDVAVLGSLCPGEPRALNRFLLTAARRQFAEFLSHSVGISGPCAFLRGSVDTSRCQPGGGTPVSHLQELLPQV